MQAEGLPRGQILNATDSGLQLLACRVCLSVCVCVCVCVGAGQGCRGGLRLISI